MIRKIITIFVTLLFLTACNLDTTPPSEPLLAGTWRGILTTASESLGYQVLLTILPGGSGDFTGTIIMSSYYMNEEYPLIGTVTGNEFRFEASGGRRFWGTFTRDTLTGNLAWDCYDCSPWGSYTLGRGEPPSTGEVSFIDLVDGDPVALSEGPLGPQVEVEVRAAPMANQGKLFLEADGLMMDLKRSDELAIYTTTMTWWPWHGNGEYELRLTSWPLDYCCRQAVQTITVTVSDFPTDRPTITQHFIQLYQQEFGIILTEPVITRYLRPWEDAVDVSRWTSVAYIRDMMYELELFDDGSSIFYSRPLNHILPDTAPLCKPAGEYEMLVAFVDYHNTGITGESMLESLVEAEIKYNDFYLEQALAAGSSDPILQVHATGVYIDGPVTPGEILTPAEISTRTGIDTSLYDLLVEVDLDSTLSVANTLLGLGFGGTGCHPGGSPYVDIYFVITGTDTVDFSGTVFDHELSHSLGWMHWWPNLDAGAATQLITDIKHNAAFPTLLFGWTDADGDGIVEILDPTPYGLIP